jgi:hypothetical protein
MRTVIERALSNVSAVLAILVLLATSAEAQLSVSADTWSDDGVSASGNFQVYGMGAASGQGMVMVTAWLRNPDGSGLDYNEVHDWGSAQANVSATLNIYSMQHGDYDTLATAMDDWQNAGCQTSPKYGIKPYLTNWMRLHQEGQDPGERCNYGEWIYWKNCYHDCGGEQWLCRPQTATTPFIEGAGLKITFWPGSWCTPSTKADSTRAACILPGEQ